MVAGENGFDEISLRGVGREVSRRETRTAVGHRGAGLPRPAGRAGFAGRIGTFNELLGTVKRAIELLMTAEGSGSGEAPPADLPGTRAEHPPAKCGDADDLL